MTQTEVRRMEPGGGAAAVDGTAREVTSGAVADPWLPEDLARRLSMVIGQLIRLMRRQAPSDVGPGSLAALATLSRSGPMRLGDLAVREGVAPPTLTRMIAVLEDAGYVVRKTDPSDRRAVQVSVTEGGAQVVAATVASRADVLLHRLGSLQPAQLDALIAALPALEALASDHG